MQPGIYVYCQTRFIGFHRWPNAPESVYYLRHKHRHEFRVKVIVKVKHDDRDVEFITLKDNTNNVISNMLTNMERDEEKLVRSCEQIAKYIQTDLETNFKYIIQSVEVSEDGENGAIVVC